MNLVRRQFRPRIRDVTAPDQMQKNASNSPVRTAQDGGARTLTSAEIFEGATEVQILHEQAVYRLKITRQGKLILNK